MATKKSISFIGAGNMASAIIGGLIADGYDPKKIWASNPTADKLKSLQQKFGIHITQDNQEAAQRAEILVLAVKPKFLHEVTAQLADIVKLKKPLVLSIAAMIPTTHLEKWLGNSPAIIRCMPNTPALLCCGATALFANAHANVAQKKLAEGLMRSVGLTVWLDREEQMEIATVLSGSGPAYFFHLMEVLEEAAKNMGLPADTARLLTVQTAVGAAQLALETAKEPTLLRQEVTSPGGSTERAFEILMPANLHEIFHNALKAARQRGVDMANKLKES